MGKRLISGGRLMAGRRLRLILISSGRNWVLSLPYLAVDTSRPCRYLQTLLPLPDLLLPPQSLPPLTLDLAAASRPCGYFQTLLPLPDLANASRPCYLLQTLLPIPPDLALDAPRACSSRPANNSRPCYPLQTLLPPPDLAASIRPLPYLPARHRANSDLISNIDTEAQI